MATARALIDTIEGELTLRVEQEKVVFKIPKILKYPKNCDDLCVIIDSVNIETCAFIRKKQFDSVLLQEIMQSKCSDTSQSIYQNGKHMESIKKKGRRTLS